MKLARCLWLQAGPAPHELLTYLLCQEVYHCRPSELRQERLADILPHMTVREMIAKVKERSG